MTKIIILYHKTWLHILTNYEVFLRPPVHIQQKLQLHECPDDDQVIGRNVAKSNDIMK